MNSVSLLVFWLLPLLPAGGPDQSPHLGDPRRGDVLVTTALIRRPIGVELPDDRDLSLPAATEGDGEDSCEGFLFDTAHAPFPLWERPVENDRSSPTHPEHEHPRSPSLILPLLC